MLFDSHCHLYDERFRDDLEEVIDRARQQGVRYMVVPGVDAATSEAAIALAERFTEVYAAAGVHPESLKDFDDRELYRVEELLKHPKVVAVGEIGLDYYWDVAPRPVQQEVFIRQVELARAYGLPIIVHNRDATEDTVRIVEHECTGVTGVLHCFTGSVETARRCIARGFMVSYGGPLTFQNAANVRKAAAELAGDSLLIETDSPYLSPHPFRGKRNEPARVELVARMLAETRGETFEQVAERTTDNALRLFAKVGGAGA